MQPANSAAAAKQNFRLTPMRIAEVGISAAILWPDGKDACRHGTAAMFSKIRNAHRGGIARRIIKAADRLVLRCTQAKMRNQPDTAAIPSARAGRAPSAVNLLADKRNRPLIGGRSVPGLDHAKIGFARLVSRARAPAMGAQEICRRG
jgi:hypothetical protein